MKQIPYLNNMFLRIQLILFLNVKLSIAIDSQLVQLFSFMEDSEQVFVIYDQNTYPLDLRDNMDTTEGFGGKLELGFTDYRGNSSPSEGSIAKFSLYSFESDKTRVSNSIISHCEAVKVIGRLKDASDTALFISQIGDPNNGLQFILNSPWFLIIWPEDDKSGNTNEREATLYNYLNTSTFIESFPVNSQFYVGFSRSGINSKSSTTPNSINELFIFYEAYGLGGELILKQVTELGSVFVNCWTCPTYTSRRSDLQGVLLRAEGLEDPEFKHDTDYKYNDITGEFEFTNGFSVMIFMILQRALNFTYKASIMTPDIARGMGGANSWDAVIQRVEEGKVDFGVSLTVQLREREDRVYFLPPTDENKVSAFFRPPSSEAIRDIFTQPFKLDLWAAVVSTWLVLAFSMILFSTIRQRVGAGDPSVEEPDFTQSSFIWALATACQQGWDEHPVSGSMRTIFISGSFTGVVAYAGYSAAIVSTLSQRIDPIKTPQELIDSSLGIEMHSGFLDNILSSTDANDIITQVNRRLDPKTRGATNSTTGYGHLATLPYAFISITDTFYDVVVQSLDDKQICDIRELSILKKGFPAGHFLARDSPYKEYFRTVIIKTRERGVLWRLTDFFAYTRRCQTSADNQGQALGANDVFTAFMILLAGYVMSVSFLFIEKIIFIKKISYVQ